MQLQPLPLKDAILLIKRRKKEYLDQEVGFLTKFDEKLERSRFGLSLIGSLLSELVVTPSTLFEAINNIRLDEVYSHFDQFDERFWGNNRFLLKVLIFCITILQSNGARNVLASKMLLVGVWFAPLPISSNLLAAVATNITGPTNRFKQWAKCADMTFLCCLGFLEMPNS
ncbi:uncharacterized protein LOC143618474 [Bidens hawaiensis]|uniref:uncharacterized protein LOC143618474 n=1 Tax=Bidens hawaiensis TaxID=980011 RepID=UPI00404B3F04